MLINTNKNPSERFQVLGNQCLERLSDLSEGTTQSETRRDASANGFDSKATPLKRRLRGMFGRIATTTSDPGALLPCCLSLPLATVGRAPLQRDPQHLVAQPHEERTRAV